jgi:phospholipid transport system transporter-binding protein
VSARAPVGTAPAGAALELVGEGRARVTGALGFKTVSALLAEGSAAIDAGRAAVIDLGAVTGSDSSGLALLIEWLSVARRAGRELRYENVPVQLRQLARLSEVEGLISPGAASR